jgi:hypothetical protein
MADTVFALHDELMKIADGTFNIENAISIQELENSDDAESRLNGTLRVENADAV